MRRPLLNKVYAATYGVICGCLFTGARSVYVDKSDLYSDSYSDTDLDSDYVESTDCLYCISNLIYLVYITENSNPILECKILDKELKVEIENYEIEKIFELLEWITIDINYLLLLYHIS